MILQGNALVPSSALLPLFSCFVVSNSATPWTTVHQASLSFIIFWSLLKLMSIESVMPSNHLILCQPLLLLPSIFPSLRVFSSELALHIWWPRIGASASLSALLMTIQGWYPLGLTGLISLLSNSQESSPAPLCESINSLAFSLLYGPTLIFRCDYWKNHSFDYTDLWWQIMSLLFNMLSWLVIAFLPRSKHV